MKAESPGPSVSKFVPRVRGTAKILYQIYIAMTIVLIASLLISGMSLFESLTLSFGAAGTGGFARAEFWMRGVYGGAAVDPDHRHDPVWSQF